jgi:hypothetical protein
LARQRRSDADRRIDYIMSRRSRGPVVLNVRGCRLCFDAPIDGVWASDHFGVVADFRATDV